MLSRITSAPAFDLGAGLKLRPLGMQHDSSLLELIETHRENLRQWQNWPDQIHNLDHVHRLIQHSLQKVRDNNGFDLVILVDGVPAGKIGLVYVDWHDRMTEIGYWLAESYQHRGIMTRSCYALVDYVFTKLNLEQIHIRCAEGNLASRAIPVRLGFNDTGPLAHRAKIHGKFHDEILYVLKKKQWSSRMIYHITSRTEWEQAQSAGVYRAPSLDTQGFIHLSSSHNQTNRVANAIYAGREDLIVLCVDPARLRAVLKFEPPDTSVPAEHYHGELFPHLYGELNLDAVKSVVALAPNANGKFTIA